MNLGHHSVGLASSDMHMESPGVLHSQAPGSPSAAHFQVRRQSICVVILFTVASFLAVMGIIAASLGAPAGGVLLGIAALLYIGGSILAYLTFKKEKELKCIAHQQGPQITGYTPVVVGGSLVPPLAPASPIYNPSYPPPSAPVQSNTTDPSEPPPSYNAAVGRKKRNSKAQLH